jgi:hypothetical protein
VVGLSKTTHARKNSQYCKMCSRLHVKHPTPQKDFCLFQSPFHNGTGKGKIIVS